MTTLTKLRRTMTITNDDGNERRLQWMATATDGDYDRWRRHKTVTAMDGNNDGQPLQWKTTTTNGDGDG